jgi:external thioesterase TEII
MKKPQLFLLHFAGGNCYSFQFMMSMLRDFEVISLELPGRGKRMSETLLRNFDEAARDVYAQLLPKISSPVFLMYGHSMGAYLALRVANMLEKAGKVAAAIIVSGNAGPGIMDPKKRYLMEPGEFKEELKKIGGVPDELLQDEELFSFFEPILRADFEIAENTGMENEPPISSPLFAIMGTEEDEVNEITNWANFTKSSFNHEILEGDHFFIHKHPKRVAAIIKECYEKAAFAGYK